MPRLKGLLALLLFTSLALGEPPKVGFLRIYNYMNDKTTFTPYLGDKSLSKSPLLRGEKVSGVYFHEGNHKLELKSRNFTLQPAKIMIKKAETLTIIALQLFDPKKETYQPLMISLDSSFPPIDAPKAIPLRIRSFSKSELELDLSFDKHTLKPMKAYITKEWKGKPFILSINGKKLTRLEPEDEDIPHTLIIWDKDQDEQQAALIPNTEYRLPDGIRKDLSFGKKREDFKNLRRLSTKGNNTNE